MAAGTLYTIDKNLQKTDLLGGFIHARVEETPFLAMLARGSRVNSWKSQYEIKPFVEAYDAAITEGVRKPQTFKKNIGPQIEAQTQLFRSIGYSVTRQAQKMKNSENDNVQNSLGFQKAQDGLGLAKSIERALLSIQEAVPFTGEGDIARTRGAFSWLDPAQHAVMPIADGYRPPLEFTKTLEEFTNDELQRIMDELCTQINAKVHLVGLVGNRLKTHMSQFLGKVSLTQNVESGARANIDADANKIRLVVDFFEYDGGELKVMTNFNLNALPSAGFADRAEMRTSGIFIDPKMWELRTLYDMEETVLTDEGQGASGFYEAMYQLRCKNPMGQCRIMPTVATP